MWSVERVAVLYDLRTIATRISDPKVLQKGKNDFYIYSKTEEHHAEIQWPGPVVLLEFPGKK